MCKNKLLCDKIKEILDFNIEYWLYNKMCVGCERERICHRECDNCDDYIENLEGIYELSNDCEHFRDFYGFDFDEDLDEEEKEEIIKNAKEWSVRDDNKWYKNKRR